MLDNLDTMSPHNQYNYEKGVGDNQTMRRKVAILGGMAGSCLWPRDDDAWEVWGCNSLWNLARDSENHFRADRWFELHPWWTQSAMDKYLLERCPVPVYMLDLKEEDTGCGKTVGDLVPKAVEFPLNQILAASYQDYFTCTFSYQIALALHLGFKEIALVGIYMKSKREGIIERANVEFWVGYALGQGVKIHITPIQYQDGTSEPMPLCRTEFRYGYQYVQEKQWVEAYCLDVARGLYPGWQST